MLVHSHVRISVVVPVYNGERYLGACLESIADAVARLPTRRRTELEVIVCDNWSTDASHSTAQAVEFGCASRIVRPERHEENRTRNWRTGLAEACGEWSMMLHADDLMSAGALTALLHATESREGQRAALIVGRHRTFEDDARPSGLRT